MKDNLVGHTERIIHSDGVRFIEIALLYVEQQEDMLLVDILVLKAPEQYCS